MKPIALQMYTIREACERDLAGMLRKVADIGFKGVEFANLHGMAPADVRKMLDDLGLRCCSSHVPMPTKENVNQLVDQENTLGNTRLVSGFGPDEFKTIEQCERAAARVQEAASLLEGTGMTLGYHNHWWEFEPVEGKIPHDILMDEAPSVFAEIDVYWAAWGKSDPVRVVEQKKDRAPLLHIKDGTLKEAQPHTAVGAGALDMRAIVAAADPNVLEWLVVELDSCATDMMQAVRDSYRYMTSEGLAQGNR
ncbi:MAG: sugar phosphate isomerase/epimerase family protein [Armatimonadota bacterium]